MPRGKYQKPSALTALEVGSRVWIYVRVSSEQQANRETPIEGQISELRRFAEEHGWVVERVFADEAQGGSYDQREAFQEMIEESKRRPRPVDGILVWNFSRFARDQLDAQFYKADLRRRGYILISYSDDIPAGDFSTVIEAFIDWKNQRYLEDLSKDVKRGLRMVAEQGYAPGGFPPRGYKAERVQVGTKRNGEPRYNSKWVVDERLRDKVTMAWQMAADSASYREIHRATNLFKNATCYNAFFQNKTYIGIRKCGQVEVPGAHEPLVTQDLFNKGQERLFGKQRVRVHPRRVRSSYLLSGLAFCGYCRSALNGGYDPRREDLTFYKCGLKWRNGGGACPSSRISAKVLENTVLDALRDSVFSEENIDLLIQEVNQELSKLISNVGAR